MPDTVAPEFGEFVARMELVSGLSLEDLSSRSRNATLTGQRVELATLAIGRYGLRVCDIAALVRKHPNSVTKWLNRGLHLERNDPDFRAPRSTRCCDLMIGATPSKLSALRRRGHDNAKKTKGGTHQLC